MKDNKYTQFIKEFKGFYTLTIYILNIDDIN